MRGHFLSKTDRKTLGRFPLVVDSEELVHCFSLTEHDHQEILWRRKRPGGRLAAGLQIGALRLLGFIPVELHTAPVEVVRFVADQVEAHVDDLETYSARARTLHAHAELIERHLGFRRPRPDDLKMLGDWLLERALEHDRPIVLFRMACRHLKTEGLVRPGVTVLERLVLNARRRAMEVTWQKLEPYTDADRRRRLDALLDVDPGLGMTPLAWFHRQATAAVPMMICSQLTKLERLRELDVDPATVKDLNPNRVRHLASLGRRMTAQALRRSEPARRYQILTATVVETLYSLTYEILELFDIALAVIDRRARNDFDKLQLATAKKSNIVARLFGEIGRLVLDDDISDDKLRAHIFNVTSREDLEEMVERAERIARPKDECHLDFLLSRYGYTRQYTPRILAAFDFQAAHPEDPLTVALKILKRLNRQGTRLVPADAPVELATRKWRRRLTDSKGRILRKYWEFCTLFRAREALRGANLWVEHSRRYQHPKNFLLSDEDWRFSPRLRGPADQRLWRLATIPTQGAAAGFLKHSINPKLFLDRWDDLLRIAATIRHGHAPASLLVSRLQASARKNDLTRALQEYGRVIKTISALRSMHSKDKRRQIHRQLNKGESIHALRRKLFFANLGQLQRRRPDDQELQAQCLTLLTNAIICWNTVYLAAAFDHIENADGIILDKTTRQHLSPTVHRHINLHGRYDLSNLEAPSEGNLRPLQT